jgi:hypothetical protein
MTLKEMKAAILADRSHDRQRGPNDTTGHSRDSESRQAIARARTWADLDAVAPAQWRAAISNRCHRSQLCP